MRQVCTKGKHVVATVHGDDITIGGERSVVEILIKIRSTRYEVVGEDADLEKSGRILSRVIDLGCDVITIEVDQRHVREMLKGLELERANHAATRCNMDEKNESNSRSDGSKGRTNVNRDGAKPNTIGILRVIVTTVKHSQVATLRSTEHLSYETAVCHKIDQISSSRQCKYAVEEDWKVSWSDHVRWTLFEGIGQEAAGGFTVHRRERAVRRSQNRIRRAGDPERGKGFGEKWIGCIRVPVTNSLK